MLYATLLFTLAMVACAHVLARREPYTIRLIELLVCMACVGVAVGTLGLPLVVLGVAGLLFVALVVWPLVRTRLRTFLPLSLVAVAVPYGIAGWNAHERKAALDRYRQEYPFESLAGRLPVPRAEFRAPLPHGAAATLDGFERAVQDEANQTIRSYQLRWLHEHNVEVFVSSPGFGVRRAIRSRALTAESLKEPADRGPTPGQPGSPAAWGRDEPFEPAPAADRDRLSGLHAGGLLDFVNPRGWGYAQSRDRVAGFVPHRFSKVPEAETLQVQRIELVGLLKHPAPVAYLSDRLPAMNELRDAPTRPLDTFEAAGLDAVRKGEDVFAARRGDVVRFVGAVRGAKQCVDCHGGERGDLLGAFSYTLRAKTSP
jgi:hypothetical protein